MENSIRKSNKIPGSERLTRPEEISALSKYLKEIHKIQDEHTEFTEDILEVPGRTTGKLPKIDSLSDYSEKIQKQVDKVERLPENVLKLKDSREISLPDNKIGIEDGREELSLLDKRLILDDNRTNELSSIIEKLDDSREISLPDTRLNIENESIDSLDNTRIDIENKPDPSLSETKLEINDSRDINLESEKISLNPKEDIGLENTRLGLDDAREVNLESTKISIENLQETELDNTRLDLEDSRENQLENTKININDLRENTLDTTRLDLKDFRNNELETEKINLEGEKEDNRLENTRIDLEDTRENQLGNTKIDIKDSRNNALDNTILNLTDKRNNKLENTRLDLEDSRKPELENEKINIQDTNSPDLETTKIKIDTEDVSSLNTTRLDIKDGRDNSLETERLDLEDKRKIQLENGKINIDDQRENTLDSTRLDLEDTRENQLSSKILPGEGEINEVEELYDSILGLEDNRENQLEDTRLNLEDLRENTLSDTKLNIKDDRENNLETERLDIQDLRDNNLDTTRLDLKDSRENSLDDTRLDLEDSRNNKLSETRVDIKVEEKPDSLDFTRIDKINSFGEVEYGEVPDLGQEVKEGISSTNPHSVISNLNDSKIDLQGIEEKPDSLENTRLDIEVPKDVALEDTIVKEPEEVNPDLSTFIDEIEDSRETNLSNTRLDLEDTRENQLSSKILSGEGEINEVEELYDSALSPSEKPNEVEELYDSVLGIEDDQEPELEDTIIKEPEENEVPLSTLLKQLDLSNVTDAELYTELIKLLTSEGEQGYQEGWEEKLAALMSAYLSGDNKISPEKAVEYEAKLYETLDTRLKIQEKATEEIEKEYSAISKEMPGYKLPEVHWGKIGITGSLGITSNGADALNVSNYLRGTAELAVSGLHGNARRILLEETLAALVLAREAVEKLAKANRERLPGDDYGLISDIVSGGVSGAIKSAAKSVISTATGYTRADMKNPINRPTRKEGKIVTDGFNAANSRISQADKEASEKSILGKILYSLKTAAIGKLGSGDKGIKFKDTYLGGDGIKTTIKELCMADEGNINSVEELKNILIAGPYITTPKKFGTITSGLYGAQTLDTNSYWEIVLEPYTYSGPEQSGNGGYSFLPSIQEINTINAKEHGVSTAYSSWIPFTGFELQKSKLTTKSVGLYDGEIVFPVSSEYTNELRLTIADDQFKSWRNYFQKVADVSVYASTPHKADYYTQSNPSPTAVDKRSICIALYKNVTFNIKIYVMTPQFSTIKKFNLLCVLKDFSEEYSGEVDSGGTDLSVGFSIVGELNRNIESAFQTSLKTNAADALKKITEAQEEKATSLMGAIDNCIGLLG